MNLSGYPVYLSELQKAKTVEQADRIKSTLLSQRRPNKYAVMIAHKNVTASLPTQSDLLMETVDKLANAVISANTMSPTKWLMKYGKLISIERINKSYWKLLEDFQAAYKEMLATCTFKPLSLTQGNKHVNNQL